ncbi:MAG TPA: Os1348 family NHLP clan protein [Candidatus Saccharimonadales bacterium]|nr:Os1348 family NHLP clan protein [Candidatus Saccharimonadales bacterium]
MTSKQLGTVIQRAISDGAFRRQLQSDPTAALRGFDLTSDEVAAIRGGDPTKLSSLGVDQRLSKTFALGDALGSVSRSSTVSDLNTSGSTALPDGGAAGGQNALSDVGRSDGQALISDGGSDGVAHDAARFGDADGARDGIVGDPTSARLAVDDSRADGQAAVSDGNSDGIAHDMNRGTDSAGSRALHDDAPADTGTFISGDTAGTRALHDDAPADTGTLVNDSNTTFGDRYDDAPSGTTSVAASSDGGDRYGDAFITADEAGRYGVAGHGDGTVNAEAGGNADLGQNVIDPGSLDTSDAHSSGDALSNTDDAGNSHSWG